MTAKLKRVKIFGEGVYSKSPVVTRQRRLNCYLEVRKDADKSAIICYGTPGMAFAFNPNTSLNMPARGLVGNNTALYEVVGNQVLSLSQAGAILASGILSTSTGLVGMALNPTQLMIVDGSLGYIFAGGAVVIVGGAFPNGARTVTQCNGFFAVEQPGSNTFWVSAFGDGTTWNGLSFAAAVQVVDGLLAMESLGGLLIPMSSGHVEFWQNVGATQEPFQYIQNSAAMWGLAAIASRVHAGDDLYFIAQRGGGSVQNSSGSYQVARIRGYQVSPVSTTDIDNILQSMAKTSTIADATGYSFQQDEHLFCQWNFPTANRSLLLDTVTGFWSEVQTGVTTLYAARHIGNLACQAYGQTYIADYSNGNIYTPDPGTFTDNGNVIVREVVTPCALEDFNTFRIGQIYLDMQTGVGLANPALQGYSPNVALSIARDNRDFGPERLIPLGLQGQTMTRVNARRWGRARQANLKIRMTDPVPFVITAGGVMTSQRQLQPRKAA